MRIYNLVLTTVVVLPFTLLAGYYFFSILWNTLQDKPESTTWKSRTYYAGLVLVQVVSICLFLVAIYLVIYAGIWTR